MRVLTSTYGVNTPRIEGEVFRWLRHCFEKEPDWQTVVLKEAVNQRAFDHLSADFQPDVVLLWNLTHISLSLAYQAQELGLPTCYYVSDKWLATWEMDHWYQLWRKRRNGYSLLLPFLSRLLKLALPPSSLDLARVMFSSRFLRDVTGQVGKPVTHASVIHWGLDDCLFPYKRAVSDRPKRLLYVGQVAPHKGVHTAIQALGLLKREHGYERLSLSIVGGVESSSGYGSHLRELAEIWGVSQNVTFVGRVPREDLPNLYHAHDILVFTSVWDEPFSIALLEAMSCGLAVVGTATGGTAEVIKPEVNALVFPKENAKACAQQILRLLGDPGLFESVRENGRGTIEQKFRIEQSVDSIEAVLAEAHASKRRDQEHFASGRGTLVARSDPSEALAHISKRVETVLLLADCARRGIRIALPRSWKLRLRNASYKAISSAALLILPLLYDRLFRFVGMRRKDLQIDLRQIKSVLVLQLADIGDVVLGSAFLRELRYLLPHAWIGLMVQPHTYNLVEKCPYVNDVIAFNWRAVKNWRAATLGHLLWWTQATSLARRHLWKHRIDLAISPRWNNDSCQAAALISMCVSGAPWRIGYVSGPVTGGSGAKMTVGRLLTHGSTRGFPRHEVERQLDILRWLGAKIVDTNLELWTSPDDGSVAQQLLNAHGIRDGDVVIGFAPGAAWPKRRWPADRFIELGRWLQEGHQVYILVIGSEAERELCLQIERGLHRARTVNLVGKTTLRQMAAVARRCWLFVVNDSGPMHVLGAAGVPVVGLFGPGEFERFKPRGGEHEVASLALPCSPCCENCMFDHPYCMEGITVDQVKRIISSRLERRVGVAEQVSR